MPKQIKARPKPRQSVASRLKSSNSGISKKLPYSNDLSVVFENDLYLILDKPAGIDSQNSRQDRPSVVDWLSKHYGFSGLIHRLDFGTSGLLIAAKTPKSAHMLTKLLLESKIHRVYWAFVLGRIQSSEGIITSHIDEKEAKTTYKTLEKYSNATLVEISLHTGRKHQIRKHFSEIKHPILGDHLYGNQSTKLLFNRPALHAKKLMIEDKTYESSLPKDLIELQARLKIVA